ncbi:hypothetical protein Tco_0570927 [Tanacetum coccineum]
MHNNIMAAGSKERPPMLGPGRYSQWHSRFLRYLDTKSNVAAHEEVETIHNMTAENKLYFQAEKEAIFLILTECKAISTLMRLLNHIQITTFRLMYLNRSIATIIQVIFFHDEQVRPPDQGKEIIQPVSPQSETEDDPPRLLQWTIVKQLGNKGLSQLLGAREKLAEAKSGVKDYAFTQGEDDDDANKLIQGVPLQRRSSPADSSSTDTPLEQIPFDTSDPVKQIFFCSDGEETVTLEEESRSRMEMVDSKRCPSVYTGTHKPLRTLYRYGCYRLGKSESTSLLSLYRLCPLRIDMSDDDKFLRITNVSVPSVL